MQKVTENYLSKVTRYFYFVTSQHWKRVRQTTQQWQCSAHSKLFHSYTCFSTLQMCQGKYRWIKWFCCQNLLQLTLYIFCFYYLCWRGRKCFRVSLFIHLCLLDYYLLGKKRMQIACKTARCHNQFEYTISNKQLIFYLAV